MKYIEKINWEKIKEPVIAVTLTNLKNKYNPVFQIHKLNPEDKSIEDLGLFDKERFEKLVREQKYEFWKQVMWDDWGSFDDSVNEYLNPFYARFADYGKWVIGDLLGTPSKKISSLV